MLAEETPGLEGVPAGLAGEQDLLVEMVLHVGLDVAQSLLSQPTEATGEGGVGVHVEVLVDLLINLGVVDDAREVWHGIDGEESLGLGWFCFYPFLFDCIPLFI